MSNGRRRDTKPMASRGHNGDQTDPDVFDTRKTVAFERAPDGALIPTRHIPEPEEIQPPRSVPPLEMAASSQIEAFRELRTRLLVITSGLGLKEFTILVVPMALEAGASFVARNLAAALALQEHGRAVLVDCDFRNPTQQNVLNKAAQGDGLSDFLDQSMHLTAFQPNPVDRLIVPTAIPGLHLIPAGRCEAMRAGRPREYFSSRAMRTLMNELRMETSYVVLDGPALDSSPDARILSALADVVVLVVGYGQTSPAEIAKAAEAFDRAKFAGVVFNDRGAGPSTTRKRR